MDTKFDRVLFENKVLAAMQKPYVWPEIEELTKNERILAQKYLYEGLKKEEFEKKLNVIQAEIPSIIAKSVLELETILDLLKISDEVKIDTLNEMSYNFDQAVAKGYKCRFAVWFYKAINKGIALYCATQIYIP